MAPFIVLFGFVEVIAGIVFIEVGSRKRSSLISTVGLAMIGSGAIALFMAVVLFIV